MLRLNNSQLLAFISVVVFLATSLMHPPAASAVSASDWRAGNITDDGIFYDSSAMSTQEIQNFLNSKVPTCDTNGTKTSEYGGGTRAQYGASKGYPAPYTCLKNYVENPTTHQNNANGGSVSGGVSSAQIIKTAADTYGINPKALLVLLQKEQTLITDDWPWTSQYRSATGYGCPDTAPCDSDYYGFYNQVSNAAHQFLLYKNNPTNYRYKPYQNNTIQYSPNSSCGSTTVFIENRATAGLYNYTPYQPNASALNNLYGSGDSCGAYGNRNYWRLFSDWFGTTYSGQRPASLTGKVTALTQASGKVNVFVRGTDDRLWQKWFSGGNWYSSWNYIDGPSSGSSTPSAISFGDGHMDVFETRDGQLRHNWYQSDSSAWRGWGGLGRPSGVDLKTASTVSQTSGKINVFSRGSDGRLWQRWFANGAWSSSWNYIEGPTYNASTPSAISFGNGHMDVFEIKDGQLFHNWYNADATAWRGWGKIF